MNIPRISVIAGPSGAGKTTWIYQQLVSRGICDENVLYYSPATGNVPIDQTRLSAELLDVTVFNDGQKANFLNQLPKASLVYIELGSYLQLSSITQILENITYRSVAILPPHIKDSEWHSWAKEIVPGAAIDTSTTTTQMWRGLTTGKVLDEDSLDEFWYEITHGAYKNTR
jgi:hypothetical protein